MAWDAAALPEGWSARLVDTATGESRSLASAGVYGFETEAEAVRPDGPPALMAAAGGAARFRVVLAPQGVSGEGVAGGELAVSVGPNPVSTGGVVRVRLPAAGMVRVVVYDVLGRQVAVLADGERAAGTHDVALGAERLTPGVYVVRLTAGVGAGAASVVRRVTVVR